MIEFAILVVSASASGVMAPGPLTAACISHGLQGGARSGVRMAAGHAAAELPVIIALWAGAAALASVPGSGTAVSAAGAVALFAFAILQARAALAPQKAARGAGGSFLAGMALTGLNPFFLVWWGTIGLKLVSDASAYWGLAGILALFGLHVWMDFAWLGGLGHAASRASRLLSGRTYRAVMVGLAGVMAWFGASFLIPLF